MKLTIVFTLLFLSTVLCASSRHCPEGSWWAPTPLTTWQWQLQGTVDTSVDVQMYDVDLFDTPQATIDKLHKDGRVVICYFSTQYESWRADAKLFTPAVLGKNLDDWEGEKWVDIRSPIVRTVMQGRLDLAFNKSCDGVEPDNVDGYSVKTGFPLTANDQISFNTFLANEAHTRSLSVALKNDLDQAKALQPVFDWALNEECYSYDECTLLNPFISANKAVFNAEYSGTAAKVCPYMVGLKFSSLIKKIALDASITAQCCTYENGGCKAQTTTCKTKM